MKITTGSFFLIGKLEVIHPNDKYHQYFPKDSQLDKRVIISADDFSLHSTVYRTFLPPFSIITKKRKESLRSHANTQQITRPRACNPTTIIGGDGKAHIR